MRRKTKPTVLSIGRISTGTCRAEDIFPAIAYELSALRLSRADRATFRELVRDFKAFEAFENDNAPQPDGGIDDAMYELYNLAESYAPPFCYVGSHPGDGADIGVWIYEELFYGGFSDEVARDRETASPEHSYALEANDHGNATLWHRAGSRWVKCWSVV